MQRGPIVVTVSLALTASITLAPTAGLAGQFQGGPAGRHPAGLSVQFHGGRSGSHPVVHGFSGGHPFVSHPIVAHPFSPRPFFPRRFSHPFGRFGVIASPVVVYAPPAFYGPPAYYDQSGYYGPQAVYYTSPAVYNPPMAGTISLAPTPSPTPSVIEYPTGRYELRGDGVTTLYTWVWIPNPPPPPPAAPPAEGPASGDPSPARHTRLYRWTDGQGVVHFEDRREPMPQR